MVSHRVLLNFFGDFVRHVVKAVVKAFETAYCDLLEAIIF